LSWTYPADQLIALRRAAEQAAAAAPVSEGLAIDSLHFNYSITGDTPAWRPLRAFDDGRQTFVEFPASIAVGDAPPLFVIGPTGEAELVNYRVRGRFYVVDRIFAAHLSASAHGYTATNTAETPTLEELSAAVAESDRWYLEYVSALAPGYSTLRDVRALGNNNVWAVGYTLVDGYNKQPYVVHFDGTSWRRIPTPVAETGATLNDVVALSASNVVAVGTAANTGLSLVLHWNGSSWIRESVEPTAKLTGAAAVGPNTFWAVGNTFALNEYEERTFTAVSR